MAKVTSFNLPLIPFQLLMIFVCQARHYSDEYGTELHADIYWDNAEKKYHIDFPDQLVTPVTVEPQSSVELAGKMRKVMELHSHHVMSPRPSAQDDANEKRPGCLYAIVGRVNQVFPKITVRTYHNGRYIPIDPETVFEVWRMGFDLPQVKVANLEDLDGEGGVEDDLFATQVAL